MIPLKEIKQTAEFVADSALFNWESLDVPHLRDLYLRMVVPVVEELPELEVQYQRLSDAMDTDADRLADDYGAERLEWLCERVEDSIFHDYVVFFIHQRYLAVQEITK